MLLCQNFRFGSSLKLHITKAKRPIFGEGAFCFAISLTMSYFGYGHPIGT
jgi:hypothetical protein